MKQQRWFLVGLMLGFGLLLGGCASTSRGPETEEALIQSLSSPSADVVVSSMMKLEKQYPTSTRGIPEMKRLLKDDRIVVKRKAARVLGVLHAEVSRDNIEDICALLESEEPAVIIDGLKSLRGLNAPQAVPRITPLLKHSHPNVVRDSCRTLAVLGDSSTIPYITPLLSSPEAAIQKDAQDAIYQLQN